MSAGGPPELVGREAELEAIEGFLAGAADALLLEGEAGIGKTSLWRHAVALAPPPVLTATAADTELALAFVVVGDLLAPIADVALAALPPPQRRALEHALLLVDADENRLDARAVGVALTAALRAVAPVVVAIDDVQWVDSASAAALVFAARRLEAEPVRFLLAARTPNAAGLVNAFGDRGQRVEVGPLSVGATHRLLRTRLGRALPRPALLRVHRAAAGNPFFALELGRNLLRRGIYSAPSDRLPLPTSLARLLLDTIGEQPPDVQEALAFVSAAGRATIAEVAASPAIDRAVAAGLLEVEGTTVRAAHPLVAAAAYEGLSPDGRRRLHLRLAEARPERRAHHLALAAEGPDEALAREIEAAADSAAARGAPAAAAELLEHALRLTPGHEAEAWARRAVAAAELYEPAGDSARSQALADEILARVPAGPRRAQALIVRSYWRSTADIGEQAVANAAGEPRVLARALYIRARSAFNRFDLRSSLRDARESARLAEELGDPVLRAHAGAELGRIELMSGLPSARATLERARAEREHAGVSGSIYFSAETWLGCERLFNDDVAAARDQFEERRTRALEEDDVDALGGVLMRLVEVEWRAGALSAAARYARQNLDLDEQRGSYQRAAVTFARGLVDAALGELDAAQRDAEDARRLFEPNHNHFYIAHCRVLLGSIAAVRGDHARVLREVGTLADELGESGFGEPDCFVFADDEVAALVATGEHERAETRIIAVEARAAELGRVRGLVTAARGRAALAAARGEPEEAVRLLEHANEVGTDWQVPVERAKTTLLLGSAYRRARHRGAARAALVAACDAFDRLEAAAWAQRARDELARVSGRARSRDGALTETERRVADLVAAGRSNKEVADELFVTVRTVEANLTRIYEKLGVRRRTELAARLAR